MNRFFTVFIVLVLLLPEMTGAQVTKIMGRVTDSETREPIPFVNVVIAGTTTGTTTGFDGNYSLEFKHPGDTIKAFMIGYSLSSRNIRRNVFQTIDFELTPQQLNLPEVTIRYSGNPAERILKKVTENKERNALQSFETYQYDAYTKVQFDANNITERFQDRKIFNQFSFVWNYLDTSTLNGKSYLPVFISETMSEVFSRKSSGSKKEIITASMMSGVKNASISQFLGNLSEQVDVYRNFIMLFDKNFVSPVADFGIEHYKYYLVDSLFIGNQWCYHIMFKPRRKQELTFTGNLWIHDTSFAVKKYDMRIADDANINFINDLQVEQEFTWTSEKYWMLTRDKLDADFNVIDNAKKTVGFYGHRTSIYSNFQFDVAESNRFLRLPANVFIEPQATEKTKEFWNESRPEQLTGKEAGIYQMIDSVKKVPVFKTYTDIVYGIFNGYMSWGKVELGPYFKVFSFNAVEGARFRIGVRTSNTFSKKIELEGYVAYGTTDQTFKYGAEVLYMFSKNPRRDISALYKYDVEQLGASPTAFSTDNILTSLFHRGPNNTLTMVRDYRIAYEHEWFNGLINRIHFIHREVFPLGSTEFVLFPDKAEPQPMQSIYTSEIQFDTRLSFKERFLAGEFDRITINSNYPILQLKYAYGIPNLFKSDFEYHKVLLNVSQWFNFRTLGWSKYILEAGKIWGTLPYPLLRLHDGNQSFFYDEYASSLMDYYEFASDAWITATYTHHFNGLLFNKIPLFRKLKWREVAHIKGVYGTMTDANLRYSLFPTTLRPLGTQPYIETGAGIENILKIIRVDAVWRITHLNDIKNPSVQKFGLFVSLFFSF